MAKGAGSKKAKKSGSNIFAMFSQRQIQEFKEAFGIMDCDKNGLLSADDLVSAFAAVGKSISGGEADGMLSESPGPVNFTQMVTLFAEKMAGGTDDDDTILKSFDAFEINGKIDAEMFKHSLMTWGDKFTDTEVDDAFAEFVIEDGQIDATHLKSLMVAKKEEGEEA
jgi:Ca2+-binding EF-hand superfamily protein